MTNLVQLDLSLESQKPTQNTKTKTVQDRCGRPLFTENNSVQQNFDRKIQYVSQK